MIKLSKAISDSDTVIMFNKGDALPEAYAIIAIGSELISYVTNWDGTLYGCVRGVNSTTPAAHQKGEVITVDTYFVQPTSNVVELIESTVAHVSLYAGSGHVSDVTSITLSPGTWDISLFLVFERAGNTYTVDVYNQAFVGTEAADDFTGIIVGKNYSPRLGLPFDYDYDPHAIPAYRVVVPTTKTFYLKGYSDNHTGFINASGTLAARRVS